MCSSVSHGSMHSWLHAHAAPCAAPMAPCILACAAIANARCLACAAQSMHMRVPIGLLMPSDAAMHGPPLLHMGPKPRPLPPHALAGGVG